MGFQAAFPSALTMYQQLVILVRIVLATACGSVIGLERSRRLKGAGIRTHSVVAAASCLLMIISKYGFTDLVVSGMEFAGTKGADPSRIAAQIVSGVSEGTEVLTDFSLSGGEEPADDQARNPFMPGPRNNNKKTK